MNDETEKGFPTNKGSALLLEAMRFAAWKHRHQRRKDPAGTPYINHPLEVAHILWFEGNIHDDCTLAAAILHDTVEDTETSFHELEQRFGAKISAIVEEVTDDKTLPGEEQKKRQIQTAFSLSREAKCVKLADKISNLRDVYRDPPKGWSRERQIGYYQFSQNVVQGIRGTHALLESLFDDIYGLFFQRLKNHRDDDRPAVINP